MIENTAAQCLNPESPGLGLNSLITIPRFSFFSHPITNTVPSKIMGLFEAYELIKSDSYQKQTATLGAMTNQAQARAYKAATFNTVTFSGVFSKRADYALIKHSGLMTLDFDHVLNLQELKETLLADPYFETELLFRSPSGDGLKWIISIDLDEVTHLAWFSAIAKYIKATYQIEVDPSGKNVSRACFLPYDPEVYIHPKYIQ